MIGERRRAARRSPGANDPLSRARLRTGPELVVTEISDVGASVRTSARLLPGTHVDVHMVTTAGRVLRRARIARAAVWIIDAAGVRYQVALAFDSPVDSSVRWVGATHGDTSGGELLPRPGVSGVTAIAGSTPFEPPHDVELALDLEKGAGYTFAKESRDVDI